MGIQDRSHAAPRLAALTALISTALTVSTPAAGQAVPAEVILIDGDTPAGAGGATVTNVLNPRTNGLGVLSVVAILDDGEHILWHDDAVAWLSSDETTFDLTMSNTLADGGWQGLSDGGAWVYEPDVNGVDSIWTNNGLLVQVGDAAPGWTTVTATYTYTSRSLMTPSGAIYFEAFVDTNGDNFADVGAFYSTPDGTAANLAIEIGSGDVLAGNLAGTVSSVTQNYDVSDDDMNEIFEVVLQGGDNAMVVDGTVTMREGSPVSMLSAETWDGFDLASINNAGHYLVSGDTSAQAGLDEFIAYDAEIAVRSGDTVDNVALPGRVLAASLNDLGYAAHAWSNFNNSAEDVLFFTCNAADMASTSTRVFGTGDEIDTDGDAVGDLTVVGLNAANPNGPGIDLAEDMSLYLELNLDDGNETRDGIVRLEMSCCGNAFTDANEDCDDGDESATCNEDCTTAECGDGKINATAGEDCDDDGESATCDADCTAVECGDGTLNTSAGEECDDGNTTGGDGCDENCFPEGGVGGAGQGGSGQGGSTSVGSAQGGSTSVGSAQGGASNGAGTGGAGANAGDDFVLTDAGCGCGTARPRNTHAGWVALALAGLFLRRRRRD